MIVFKLKEIRESRKINQTELAKILGVRQEMISRWETRSTIPTLEKAAEIADILGLSIDELVDYHNIQDKMAD